MFSLSTTAPWDLVADEYDTLLAPAFARYADDALRLAGVGNDSDVLDVATGPGTLAALAAGRCRSVTGLDFSRNMLAHAETRKSREGLSNLRLLEGDGQALPLEDASFDAGFSMFGLMFFPDRAQGLAELHRVLRPRGTVVISSWVPVERSPLMQVVFGAFFESLPEPPPPGPPMPLSDPEALRAELGAAGFVDVRIELATYDHVFASPEECVDFAARSSAPLRMLATRLGEAVFRGVCARATARMREHSFPLELAYPAWLGFGHRP